MAPLPAFVVLLLTWTGIDFGRHWDEDGDKIDSVAFSLQHNFILLPDAYWYPSVNYWLTLDALAPELFRQARIGRAHPRELEADLMPVLHSLPFRLRLRRIYSFITALTGMWIYLTVLVWKRSPLEAACASLLFAFSWEVIYHGRWIAPDSITMQFGTLTFLLASVAWKRDSRRALWGAGVAAGLACGSKYPGALSVLPVLAVLWLSDKPWRRALADSWRALGVMGVTYLITTPGTLLEPIVFVGSVRAAMAAYAHGWAGYAAHPGLDHLFKMFLYFATQLFSTFSAISVFLFAFIFLGLWTLAREPWRDAVIFLIFPVVYVLYFSSQSIMIVRNYLIVTPFLFMLSARGLSWLAGKWKSLLPRAALAGVVGLLICVNAVDQVKAAETVEHRGNREAFLQDFERYTTRRHARVLAISPRLEQELKSRGFWAKNLRAAGTAGFGGAYDEYISYYSETVTPRAATWPANRPDIFKAVFGPREVNLNYYSGWQGDDRIISISAATAREAGVSR